MESNESNITPGIIDTKESATEPNAASLKLRQQRLIDDLAMLHDLDLLSESFMESLLKEAPELAPIFSRKNDEQRNDKPTA